MIKITNEGKILSACSTIVIFLTGFILVALGITLDSWIFWVVTILVIIVLTYFILRYVTKEAKKG